MVRKKFNKSVKAELKSDLGGLELTKCPYTNENQKSEESPMSVLKKKDGSKSGI